MKQKRRTTEEIIRILREADQGKDPEAVCRQHNVPLDRELMLSLAEDALHKLASHLLAFAAQQMHKLAVT